MENSFIDGSSCATLAFWADVVGSSKVESSGNLGRVEGGAGGALAWVSSGFTSSLGGGGACFANWKISSRGSPFSFSSSLLLCCSGRRVEPSYQVLDAICLFMSLMCCSICSAWRRLISSPLPPGLLSPAE